MIQDFPSEPKKKREPNSEEHCCGSRENITKTVIAAKCLYREETSSPKG
jgi:hypothetical protein